MASKRITELQPIAGADLTSVDPIPVVSLGASETRKIEASELALGLIALLPAGGIPGNKLDGVLDPGSIGTDEIANDAVTSAKLGDNSSAILYAGIANRPTTGNFIGQLAVDSELDDQNIYTWDGTSWVSVSDAALGPYEVTALNLDDNSSTVVYTGAGNQPAAGAFIGQQAIDSTVANQVFVWDGSTWLLAVTLALAAGSVTGEALANNSASVLFTGIGNLPASGDFVGQLATNSESSANTIYVWDGSAWLIAVTQDIAAGSVTGDKLANNSSSVLFAGIGNLPTAGAFVGQMATNSEASDQVIYIWDGGQWLVAIQPGDIPDKSILARMMADNSTITFVPDTLPATGDFVGQLIYLQLEDLVYLWDGANWAAFKAAGSVNSIAFGAGPVELTVSQLDQIGSIQLDTSFADATTAREFVAGPTAGAGAVGLRQIIGLDLPTAGASDQGAVSVNGGGLRMDGQQIEIDNDITPSAGFQIGQFNAQGLAVDSKDIEGLDLPPASTTEPGVVIPSPDDFTVNNTGTVNLVTQTPGGGTFTKVDVNSKGIVTSGGILADTDIPQLDAGKIGTGEFGTSHIADKAITRFKLGDYSHTFIQEAPPELNDTGHIGMMWFQQSSGSLRIFDGNSWFFVGYSVVEQQNIRFGGLFDATTGFITSLTERGVSSGLEVGKIIPVADATTNGLYVLAEVAGSNVTVTPGQTYTVGDWCLCIDQSGTGANWVRIDVTDGTSGGGGGGGGATTLDQLTDTTINSPQNGQFLIYNSTTAKWTNSGLIEGGNF